MIFSEKQINAALEVLYLCGCVLTDKTPSAERLADVSLRELYIISRFHSLTAIVYEALERTALIPSEEEAQYMELLSSENKKSVRKNLLLDTERANILAFMEDNAIWYMPLKGVLLKELYPKLGLRQMSDNDILFDECRREAVRDRFVERGYTVKSYGTGNHDVYLKEPIYNYEMHISLFGNSHSSELQSYYNDIKARLVKDEGNGYGYHFTDEDFYIYFLAHGFKHFEHGGTGLRFLLDMYVYLEHKSDGLDFDYIQKELETLGICGFEKNCRELISEMFTDISAFDIEKLTTERKELLLYLISSGTYGTLTHRVQKGVDKQGKFNYMLDRFFPGTTVLGAYHPIFKHKCLMPIGWVYRAFKLLTHRSDAVANEIKTVMKAKKD